GDDVGLEPVDDRARLLARAAVGGANDEGLAGLGLPLPRERHVELRVQLAGGVVGGVEQFGVLGDSAAGGGSKSEQEGGQQALGVGSHGVCSRMGKGQKENWARVKKVFSSSRSPPAAPPSKLACA